MTHSRRRDAWARRNDSTHGGQILKTALTATRQPGNAGSASAVSPIAKRVGLSG
jgi:hypothetical protein